MTTAGKLQASVSCAATRVRARRARGSRRARVSRHLRVVAHQGIPFNIRSAEREPSMAELQVLKRQSQERDHRIANSVDVSKGQMLLLRPERLRGAKVHWPEVSLV